MAGKLDIGLWPGRAWVHTVRVHSPYNIGAYQIPTAVSLWCIRTLRSGWCREQKTKSSAFRAVNRFNNKEAACTQEEI